MVAKFFRRRVQKIRNYPRLIPSSLMGSGQKQEYLVRVWGQKQVHSEIKLKEHPTSPTIGLKRIVPVFAGYRPWPGTRELSTLLDFQLYVIICVFLANQRSSIVPPYAPNTNTDVRRDPLHPPHPTQQRNNATPATHTYLPASRRPHEAPAS